MPLSLVPPARPDRQSRRRETRRLVHQVREQVYGEDKAALDCYGALLTLWPPGTRRGNRFWLVRGTLGNGRQIEASSKVLSKSLAIRFAEELAAGRNLNEARRIVIAEGAAARRRPREV